MKVYKLVIIALILITLFGLTKNIYNNKKSSSSVISATKSLSKVLINSEDVKVITEKNISYAETVNGDYIIKSSDFAPNVSGYGGPIELGIFISSTGGLKKLKILNHTETQSWIEKTKPWVTELNGINIFDKKEISNIDTLTGATYTTEAIKVILKKSGKKFSNLLNGELIENRKSYKIAFNIEFVILLLLTVTALYIRKSPKKLIRNVFLAITLIVTGFLFKIQFSTTSIISLLTTGVHSIGFTQSTYLVLLMPISVIIFGNYYCGYLCPYGILQELIGELSVVVQKIFNRGKYIPFYRVVTNKIKFAIMLLILFSSIITKVPYVQNLDIIQTALLWETDIWGLVSILFLLVSVINKRFWCRYFCPTGAFLSLLNYLSLTVFKKGKKNFKVLKKIHPIPHIHKCDLGIESMKDIDCLCCDRCRYKK